MTPDAPASPEVRHPEIFIKVNMDRVGPFNTDEVTGAEIKTKAGKPLDGELSRKTGHGYEPVGNDERIRIHEDEQFRYVPPTPGSQWV